MEWLNIPTTTELTRVRTDEILAVVADGNYSSIMIRDGRTPKLTFQLHVFEETFKKLRYNPFIRIGRKFIINKDYVYRISLTEKYCELSGPFVTSALKLKGVPREALDKLKTYIMSGKADNNNNLGINAEEGGNND